MSRNTREYGQASSWYDRGWAPPAKQHTKNSCSGWSERATRGYQCERTTRPKVWRKKTRESPWRWPRSRLWRIATRTIDEPLRTAQLALLGELHRLLNNRKGSLSATYKKNAAANDRAYDMIQKTIQASDALAEGCGVFEATMKKVTSEHEEGDVLCAVATEVTDELDQAQTDQDRLQDTWPTLPGNYPIVGLCKKQHLQKTSSSCREICNRRATHDAICFESRKAWQRTYYLKRKASEAQDNVFSHRERIRRIFNEHARAEGLVNDGLGSLDRPCVLRPKPRIP